MKNEDIENDVLAIELSDLAAPDDSDVPVRAMQRLINDGTAWKLEGSVGRACMDSIRAGLCALGKKRFKDTYGNTVPSRNDVVSGSKGSEAYVLERGNTILE